MFRIAGLLGIYGHVPHTLPFGPDLIHHFESIHSKLVVSWVFVNLHLLHSVARLIKCKVHRFNNKVFMLRLILLSKATISPQFEQKHKYY